MWAFREEATAKAHRFDPCSRLIGKIGAGVVMHEKAVFAVEEVPGHERLRPGVLHIR